MARKLSLPLLRLGRAPLLERNPGEKPTVDAVRQRLGGRATSEPGAGELVSLATTGGPAVPGVILYRRGNDVDVFVEQRSSTGNAPGAGRAGLVRRARSGDLAPLPVPAPPTLGPIAADARVFGTLVEGQRIRFQDERGLGEGLLLEKCRFGALVQRDDGTVVGIGFRRIWPAAPAQTGQN